MVQQGVLRWKMKRKTTNPAGWQGFSLIELMIAMAILVTVFGVVVSGIMQLQRINSAEGAKLDINQEARESIDQVVRDLHQAGYPSSKMYDPSIFTQPTNNDARVAAGLVSVSTSKVQFESDTDGSGQVKVVVVQLVPNVASSNCPCTLQRGDESKADGVSPLAQAVPTLFARELENVVNSNGVYTISGTTPYGVLNDTAYAAYKAAPVFSAFDKAGNSVALPIDVNTVGPPTITDIKTIRITLNVLSPNPNLQDKSAPVISMTAVARVND